MKLIKNIGLVFLAMFLFTACGKEDEQPPDTYPDVEYDPTPYDLVVPPSFPLLEIPDDNPMTEEGVLLGRMLFYDPILSADSTLSCSGCHKQEYAFTDENRFSTGIDDIAGTRNSMPLFNRMWVQNLFWDGRAEGLEAQALEPVENPIEMHETWPNAIDKLKRHEDYPTLFYKAFGDWELTKGQAAKAIAQFERTIISSDSRYDKIITPGSGLGLTQEETFGFEIFNTEKGDCFHCHGGILFSDNEFHNNGLDAEHDDAGLYNVTGDPLDIGLFKTPSLRNIALTAPYMHDGRFETLEEVVDFYSEGVQFSATIDPLMKNVNEGGIQLTEEEKGYLISFLHLLTDTTFTKRAALSNPFN